MKKSLNIGVFNPRLIYTASPYPGDNVFAKGLEENGYEVVRFDYRLIKEPNQELVRLVTSMKEKPEIVWFGKAERILPSTIEVLRQALPDAVFVKWAADVRNEPATHDLGHLQYIDLFLGTFAGEYLKKHKVTPKLKVMNIMTFTDSSFYKSIKKVSKEWKSEVLWTGRKGFGDNPMRNLIIDHLSNKESVNVKTFGLNDWLGDPEYLYAINGTKIGVGSNSFNRRKYSSDRLGNYMACGTFYLTQYIDGLEECFERGKELDWFNSIEELDEKIEYYLKNEKERKKIAKKGQKKILKYFDTKPLVENILNVIKTGKSKYSWDEIY